jgi:hypothetical protein
MKKIQKYVSIGLFLLSSIKIVRAQPSNEDLFVELSDSGARIEKGHGAQFLYSFELVNPYISQNTVRFVYEYIFEPVIFCQIEFSKSDSNQTEVLEKIQQSFENSGYQVSAKAPKTSFGFNVGVTPVQMLANSGFFSNVKPLDFRFMVGGGGLTYSNSDAAIYLSSKIEAILGIKKDFNIHLAYRSTFTNPFGTLMEFRGDLEMGLGWRF